LKIGN